MEASTADPDPEKDESFSEEGGYERTAQLMGGVPDLAIFHSYACLSAESLLHYQAEIKDAQIRLEEIRARDRAAAKGSLQASYDHNSSMLRQTVGGSADSRGYPSEQWRQMVYIRGLLKDYHEALLLHQKVAALSHPQQGQLNSLRQWMNRPAMGNIKLLGEDYNIWNDSKVEELVSMARGSPDGATWTWNLSMRLLMWYHDLIGRRIHKSQEEEHLRNTILYQERSLIRGVVVIKGLVACLLPIGAIVVLNAVKSMSARLGIIAAFTAVFSLAIGSLTSATLKDIFAATAAFSAVLVVFVGTTDQQIIQRAS